MRHYLGVPSAAYGSHCQAWHSHAPHFRPLPTGSAKPARSSQWGRFISLLSPHRTGNPSPAPFPLPLPSSVLLRSGPYSPPSCSPSHLPLAESCLPQHLLFHHLSLQCLSDFLTSYWGSGKCQHPHPHCLAYSAPPDCNPSCLNPFLCVSLSSSTFHPPILQPSPLLLSSCTELWPGPTTPSSPP